LKRLKILAAAAVPMAAASVIAPPPAEAKMLVGNYDVQTNRYERASWVWFISNCQSPDNPDDQNLAETDTTCLDISAIPRLKFYHYYEGDAHLSNGRYTLTVDVPDGLVCLPGFGEAWAVSMPTHETWTWDEVSLAGTIESRYDVGCFNGPPGSRFWTFALQRL
jgi:hypothetical protein